MFNPRRMGAHQGHPSRQKIHSRITKTGFLLFGSLVLILAACIPFSNAQSTLPPTSPAGTSPSGGSQSGNVANGEQIYFRGVDQQDHSISYTGGPNFGGMMMGGYLTCASCHGPEAHGGTHIMMGMQTMDAPPIYFGALVDMAKNDAGLSTYNLDNFRKAVIQGQDVDGSALSQDMPRWQMSDQDLTDLFAFLQTLH